MYAFMDELEARFDEERGREIDELIDELTDAERASITLSARLAGTDGSVSLALRGGERRRGRGARRDPLVGAPARGRRR